MTEKSKDAVFRSFNGKEYERINFKTKGSLVDEDSEHRFVSDDEKAKWNKKADNTLASSNTDGIMKASDKAKLDGIAENANAYSHPTSSGSRHIPAGGVSGQILRWVSDGTATWAAENDTTYPMASQSQNGIMSASDKYRVDNMENIIWNIILNSFHPVGTIYMSTNANNPGLYMGGEWIEWGSGRVPVGVNAADGDFAWAEKAGGIKEEYANAWIGAYNNRPETLCYGAASSVPGQTALYGLLSDNYDYDDFRDPDVVKNRLSTINHTTLVSDSSGRPISKLQPYITCYMWKRIK